MLILNVVLVNFNQIISKNLKRYFDNFVRHYTDTNLKFIHSVTDVNNINDPIDMGEPVFVFSKDTAIDEIIKYIEYYDQFTHIILDNESFNILKEKYTNVSICSSIIKYLQKISEEIKNIRGDK